MKKTQIWLWFISIFFKKHKKIILLSTFLGIFIAIFLIWILPYIPKPNPKKKIGIIGFYTLETLPEFISSKISQGLTFTLEDGSPAPALAEDWSISQDGKTYTFFLRENIYWQDEKKINSKDISYQFLDVETKYLDDKTIQFVLKEPFTPFPLLLSQPIFKDKLVGTGKYKIRKIEQKNGYINTLHLEATSETLVYQFYSNSETAKTAFKLGKIDRIEKLYLNPFANDPSWQSYLKQESELSYDQYLALLINNQNPLFQSKNFRQALAYATQKPNDSSRAYGPISQLSWAYNKDLKPYDYDPQRARQLLEKDLGDLNKASEININLSTTQTFLLLAEEIKKDWEETLGIQVKIQVINLIPQDFDILLTSEEIPVDPDQYSLWHSTKTQTLTHFSNIRIDKLLEDGRQELDSEKRKEIYSDFQKFLVEESPIIFIKYPETYSIERVSTIKPIFEKLLFNPSLKFD